MYSLLHVKQAMMNPKSHGLYRQYHQIMQDHRIGLQGTTCRRSSNAGSESQSLQL